MRLGTMGGRCGWASARCSPGFGFSWWSLGGPGPSEQERWVRILEDYQRDLEQAAADVADLIRRLREDLGHDTSQRV
jgi:hypothetical protein